MPVLSPARGGAHLGDDTVEAVGGVLGAQPDGDITVGIKAEVDKCLTVVLQLHAQRPRAVCPQGQLCRSRQPQLIHKQAGEGCGIGWAQLWGRPAAFGFPPSLTMLLREGDWLGGSAGMLGWGWGVGLRLCWVRGCCTPGWAETVEAGPGNDVRLGGDRQ